MTSPTKLYAIFHLNLAFSSIDECDHFQVVQHCYWPLLHMVEDLGIPLGIEMTAYTLESIVAVDTSWVEKFRDLLDKNACEIIASGDSQIIGPLVPAEVNSKNLQLGQDAYEAVLGLRPTLAYVNEQAVSKGLLDIYINAGFDAVVIEWDNPYSHNPDWSREFLYKPQYLVSAEGNKIRVLWNNAIAFQKLQRFAHGEISSDDYLTYLKKTAKEGCTALSVYGSDAEVFDYRPGRYSVEAQQNIREWEKIANAFAELQENPNFQWSSPREALHQCQDNQLLDLATFEHPISVKKQAKYNITRWALSGRNDLLLNQQCFHEYRQLQKSANTSADQWRSLCRLWASDLRTHLTENRYRDLCDSNELKAIAESKKPKLKQRTPTQLTPDQHIAGCRLVHEKTRNRLIVSSNHLRVTFNTFRGLSIDSLAFKQHNFTPVCGTLAHGHFDHIRYGADFYSNHLVMERFRERDRVADLSIVDFQVFDENGTLLITCELKLAFSSVTKWYRLKSENLECGFDFHQNDRPESSLRLGYITLKDCNNRPWFACHNGGHSLEHFKVKKDVDHGAPVSSIVSATSALGATDGEVQFGSGDVGLKLRWDQSLCTPLPMISSKKVNYQYLNRLWFSLIESDETFKPGGYLPPFSYTISPLGQIESR